MESIGVRELRQNASKYLDRVKRGESIEVTERGVPVAVLGPVSTEKVSLLDRLVAAGQATAPTRSLSDQVPIPADPDYDGPSATEILIQMREDERY
jgi:prevent-host-death family protein